ncbi:MAG: hypothetical protein K8S14_05340, partial [Actinomycetia bacterium]|nr:hypothetical protein [Actinomycetes bacterium]
MALFLIYGIFLVAFFADSLVGYNLIPAHVTIVTELLIYLLFLYSLVASRTRHKDYCLHLVPLFGFFLIVALCSIVVNNVFGFRPVFSLRLILRFFIFYVALINLGLTDGQLKKINTLLFILFIIQLPASAIKFYFYGFSEKTMGTYIVRGGGLTTLIPIIALGYLAGYYVFHKAKKVYLLLGIGFVLYGIVGMKAALLFLYPITFLGLYYLVYIKGMGVNVARDLSRVAFIVLISIAVAATIICVQPRLNPERAKGGSVDISYALKNAQKYTTGMNSRNAESGGGRFATTMLVFDQIWKGGLVPLFFGYGPGCLTHSILSDRPNADPRIVRIGGSYGKTGMTFILTEYGLFGLIPLSLMFCIFTHMCWKWYNYEKEHYWKAFATGSLVFALLNL